MTKLLIFFISALVIFSCNKSGDEKPKDKPVKPKLSASSGQDIYTKYCRLCHGSNGKAGISGSADLSISVLTPQEKINVITNGRKGMTAFKDQLTPEQIKLVADYIETLHQ